MADSNVLLARQPIFDRRLDVFGYELKSRCARDVHRPASDERSTELTDAWLTMLPSEGLTQRARIFVPASALLLDDVALDALPKERTVLELSSKVAPDPGVLATLERLKEAGCMVAVADLGRRSRLDPLLDRADILRVDFHEATGGSRRDLFERHAGEGRLLLAERVATQEELAEAREIGYSLFQGPFLCSPEVATRRELLGNKVNYLRFLSELEKPELDIERIEQVVKAEASIALRLLRYLNSAELGLRHEVTSVRQALRYLGEGPLKRWGSLLALTSLGTGKPTELLRLTMVRARMCELLGERDTDDDGGSSFFLTGLLSTLDALLDRPMDEALTELPISKQIVDAIHGDGTRLGRSLALTIALEQASWDDVSSLADALGFQAWPLAHRYCTAVRWADRILGDQFQKAAA